MQSTKTAPLVIEKTFNAPATRVWKAITDLGDMRKWYFNLSGFKPEVGFEFQFTGENEGRSYLHLCKITEVIPGKKLAYTWRYEGYEGSSLLTFELFPEGGKTKLKLTHEGLETFPSNLPDFAVASFREGWTWILGTSLTNFLEGTTDTK